MKHEAYVKYQKNNTRWVDFTEFFEEYKDESVTFTSSDSLPPDFDYSAVRIMFLTIINISIDDYLKKHETYWMRHHCKMSQNEAEAFLYGSQCRDICEMIDVDYEALLRVISEYKKGTKVKLSYDYTSTNNLINIKRKKYEKNNVVDNDLGLRLNAA